MIVVFSLILFLIIRKAEWTAWLVIPIGLLFDFFKLKPVGLSGLQILMLVSLCFLIWGNFWPDHRIKI